MRAAQRQEEVEEEEGGQAGGEEGGAEGEAEAGEEEEGSERAAMTGGGERPTGRHKGGDWGVRRWKRGESGPAASLGRQWRDGAVQKEGRRWGGRGEGGGEALLPLAGMQVGGGGGGK